MQVPKISQIICCNSHLMDSCEKRTHFSQMILRIYCINKSKNEHKIKRLNSVKSFQCLREKIFQRYILFVHKHQASGVIQILLLAIIIQFSVSIYTISVMSAPTNEVPGDT